MLTRQELLLYSDRTIIRPWRTKDYHTMDQWPAFTDPLSRVWNLPAQVSLNSYNRIDSRQVYAITLRDETLIGRLTLRDIERKTGSARLGITIASPFVSQGYGTETLASFLDGFFYSLKFKKMLLDVAALNERAVRCYQRLGFDITTTHWRDGGTRFINDISLPALERIEPYLRYGRHTTWVMFYDMELMKATWKVQRESIRSTPWS